jgi:penicillin amidase
LIERERSPWYDGRTRDEVFAAALARALAGPARPWGQQREIVLTNLFFAGRLPRALGFDRGPIRLPGGRATVFQCQIYRSAGRLTSFGPSVRIIAAMDQDCIHTNLIGGPSDRRFSAWYASDLRRWLDGEYKTLEP